MKKGFTLVELLAVIVILAVISTIVLPIVINTVNDSKKSTYQSSIELYGKAVKQAILNYELDKKVTPTTFTQIKPYLEFEGNSVECNTKIIYEDGEIYLKDCSVDGNLVEDYSYGKMTLADTILKSAINDKYYYENNPDFSKKTTIGLYKTEDDLGDSYYFGGNIENNYVQFGSYEPNSSLTFKEFWEDSSKNIIYDEVTPMYWRIIRINGDGTIRLAYAGTELTNDSVGHVRSIGTTSFNSNITNFDSLKYTYLLNEIEVDSTAKTFIDSWYQKHLNKKYSKYISDSIYCNNYEELDITLFENTADILQTEYSSATRINGKNPSLKCSNDESKYTVKTNIGNGKLTYPVALITAEEFFLIDDWYTMYTLDPQINVTLSWTMTPSYLDNYPQVMWDDDGISKGIYIIFSGEYGESFLDGCIGSCPYEPSTQMEVSPVINLKADVRFTGTGTKTDPYVIMTD